MFAKSIWEDQLAFNSNFFTPEKLAEDADEKRKWNSFYTLALVREVTEVLDTTDWKMHRKERKEEIPSNTLEELIDCAKYLMTLMQVHGFTPEVLEEEYYRKSAVVEQRYLQEMQSNLAGRKNIVGVDIDGVLADYPGGYVDFINKELGTNYSREGVTNYDIGAHFGIPRPDIIRLKDKFRQTGQKRYLNTCEGAKEFLQALRNAGYTVVLLTARPYNKYKRMFADTIYWLNQNGLPFDGIIFDEDKEAYLLRNYGAENVCFFVDDHQNNANLISDAGVKCYLLNRPYNTQAQLKENVHRVDDLKEVLHAESIRY